MSENIIGFSIQVKGTDSNIGKLQDMKAEVMNLEKEFAKYTDKSSVGAIALSTQIKALSSDIKKQENDIIKTAKATEMAAGSYDALVAENSKLSKALRAMPLDTTNESFKQMQAQMYANTEKLKDFDLEINRSYRNVGNYQDTFKSLKVALKAAKDEMVLVASATGMDSKEFKEASDKAGHLKDKIDDVNRAAKSAATGSDLGKFNNQLKDVGTSLLELDFKEAAERAKLLSLTVKSFSWAGMIEGGKALAVTMYEVGAAMLALPIVWVAAGIAAIVGAWYLVQKAATDSADRQVEALQRLIDMENRIADLKISLAKSAGKEVEQMQVDKFKKSKQRIDEQIKDLERLERFTVESYDRGGVARQSISNRLTDDQKKKLEELRLLQSKTQDDIYKSEAEVAKKKLELTVANTEKVKAETEKIKDNTKKILEKIEKDEDGSNEKRLEENKKLHDEKIKAELNEYRVAESNYQKNQEKLNKLREAQGEYEIKLAAQTAKEEGEETLKWSREYFKEEEKAQKEHQAIVNSIVSNASKLSAEAEKAYFDNQKAKNDRDLQNTLDHEALIHDAESASLQARLTSGAITQAQFDSEKLSSDKRFEVEQLKEKKKAFEEDKKLKIKQIAVTTALAIAEIWLKSIASTAPIVFAGVGLAGIGTAAALASAGIQIAAIQSQQFARGGVLNGKSHAQGGIPFSVNGQSGFEAEGGEALINKRSTEMYRPLLSRINEAGGGRSFAFGGALPVPSISVSHSNKQSQIDLQGFANQIINGINNKQVTILESEMRASHQRINILESESSF